MQVYPDRFEAQLAKGLLPFYLIFGDEPLQKMLAIEAIRKQAGTAGFVERQQLAVDNQFQWNSLIEATQSLSLFSDKQFIELEMPTGKPGSEGSKILTALAESPNPDTLVVLHGQKIGRDVQNTKWFKALDKHGIYVPCYSLEGKQLNNWVANYAKQTVLGVSPEAIRMLSEYCEGNLLAAKQELDKLALLFPDSPIDVAEIEHSVIDQSRFNVFQLIDIVLAGDAQKSVKLLQRLESEGVEPTIVAWALTREWQTLTKLIHDRLNNRPINWNQHRIWKNRQAVYQSALARLNLDMLSVIGDKLRIFDQQLKQSQVTRPYVELCHLCLLFVALGLSGIPLE